MTSLNAADFEAKLIKLRATAEHQADQVDDQLRGMLREMRGVKQRDLVPIRRGIRELRDLLGPVDALDDRTPIKSVVDLNVTTANIKNRADLTKRKQRADAKTASHLRANPDLVDPACAVMYQEIGMGKRRRDEKGVRAGQPDGWGLYGPKPLKTTPIGLSPHLEVLKTWWVQVSDDPGRFLPGQSERGVTLAHVRVRDTKLEFVIASTHWINGGWNFSKSKNGLRQRFWHDAQENTEDIFEDLNGQGLSVLWAGDINRRGLKPQDVISGSIPIHHKGLDYIGFLPAEDGVQLHKVTGRKIIDGKGNHTDHPFVSAAVRLGW